MNKANPKEKSKNPSTLPEEFKNLNELKRHDKRVAQALKVPPSIITFVAIPLILLVIILCFGFFYLSKAKNPADAPGMEASNEDSTPSSP